MKGLPPADVSMVRQLRGRGLAVNDIAGMMRMDEEAVVEIITKLGPQSAEEGIAEGEAWEAAETKREARRHAPAKSRSQSKGC